MKITKQTLFKIELYKSGVQWTDVFFVEASNFEDALSIAEEVIETHYEEWSIKSINAYSPLFKPTTKTITVEV